MNKLRFGSILCLFAFLLVHSQNSRSQSDVSADEHGCKVLGRKYEKTLDQYTKMGRVVWSSVASSCVAETTNIIAGTEMYSITALPSRKNLGASGGVTSWLDKTREVETAKRQLLWDSLVSPKKK